MGIFVSGSVKGQDSSTFQLPKLQFIVGDKCHTSKENKDIAQAEIDKRVEGIQQDEFEAEFDQDISYSPALTPPATPATATKTEMPTSPGGIRKEHPKLESRFLLEFTAKLLGIPERAVRERMVRRNLAFNKNGYAKLIGEELKKKYLT